MSTVQRLVAAVQWPDNRRATVVSNVLFMAGVALTAVIMPLDRAQNLATKPPYLSLIALLLLLQRGFQLAWHRYRAKERFWPALDLLAAFGLPAIAAGVASATAYDTTVAATAAILFCFVLLRGWTLAQYVRRIDLELFEDIVLWVAVAVVGFGYYQFVGDVLGLPQSWTLLRGSYSSMATYPFPRVQSFALEPLYLAHYLFLPIGVLLVRSVRRKRTPVGEQILLIFTLALFTLSLSRGAMLGLLLAASVTLVAGRSWRLLGYFVKTTGLATVVVLAMLLMAGVAFNARTSAAPGTQASAPNTTGTVDAFTSHAVDLNDGSARTRYDLWPPTLRIFAEHPLTGVGPNNSRLLLHDGSNTASTAEADALQPVNNDYLAYLSELGLLGVLLALPLIWFVLRALWGVVRARLDHPSSPYAFALVGMAFEANAFHSLLLLRTWVIIALLIAGARLIREEQRSLDAVGDRLSLASRA
jgi:O-antigen ligase